MQYVVRDKGAGGDDMMSMSKRDRRLVMIVVPCVPVLKCNKVSQMETFQCCAVKVALTLW